MRLENLLPFLVPMTFFAIWAITSLFTREAQPLPSRMNKPPDAEPQGPRPSTPQRQAIDNRRNPPNGPANARPSLNSNSNDPDIRILDSDKPSFAAAASQRRAPGPRRPSKGRPGSLPNLKRKEATNDGSISRSMGETIGETVGAGRGLVPLELPPSPLLQQNVGPISSVSTGSISPSRDRTGTLQDLQKLVQDRTRLREALIISEILMPPLSIRSRSKSR